MFLFFFGFCRTCRFGRATSRCIHISSIRRTMTIFIIIHLNAARTARCLGSYLHRAPCASYPPPAGCDPRYRRHHHHCRRRLLLLLTDLISSCPPARSPPTRWKRSRIRLLRSTTKSTRSSRTRPTTNAMDTRRRRATVARHSSSAVHYLCTNWHSLLRFVFISLPTNDFL